MANLENVIGIFYKYFCQKKLKIIEKKRVLWYKIK